MKRLDATLLLWALLTGAAGLGLHGLFSLWPSVMTEFIAPVNESLWEHVKLLYWPYLLSGLYLTETGRWRTAPWLATLLLTCALLLPLGWLIHVALGPMAPVGHVGLYLLLVAVQYLLPDRLPVGDGWTGLLSAGAIVLCGMIVCWTLLPPNHPLFHDLTLADTFFPLPC